MTSLHQEIASIAHHPIYVQSDVTLPTTMVNVPRFASGPETRAGASETGSERAMVRKDDIADDCQMRELPVLDGRVPGGNDDRPAPIPTDSCRSPIDRRPRQHRRRERLPAHPLPPMRETMERRVRVPGCRGRAGVREGAGARTNSGAPAARNRDRPPRQDRPGSGLQVLR